MKKTLSAVLLVIVLSLSALGGGCKAQAAETIPEFSGNPSVEVNGNKPEFKRSDFTTTSYESYGNLDKLGRCTPAMACLGKDLMPTQDRESIGTVKPSGWNQNKYPGLVDSDPPFLFNRCHMI